MTPISLGILASSGAGGPKIEATGGTIIDQNGYRHHVFILSGTFTVNSGQGTVFFLEHDGGYSGSNGNIITEAGGAGGRAGDVKASYVTGFPVSAGESISVSIGVSGGITSIGASKTNEVLVQSSIAAGATLRASAQNGSSGVSLSSITNNIITEIQVGNNLVSFTGGGGGGGGWEDQGNDRYRSRGLGGVFGGGNGGGDGFHATSRSGGGGGGAGVILVYEDGELDGIESGRRGVGASGYAIISYPL